MVLLIYYIERYKIPNLYEDLRTRGVTSKVLTTGADRRMYMKLCTQQYASAGCVFALSLALEAVTARSWSRLLTINTRFTTKEKRESWRGDTTVLNP